MAFLQGTWFLSGPVEAAPRITRRPTGQIYLVSSFSLVERFSGKSLISSKGIPYGDTRWLNCHKRSRKCERPASACRALSSRAPGGLFARFPTCGFGRGLCRGDANLIRRKIDDPRAARWGCVRAKRLTSAGPGAADNRAHRLLVEFQAVG